MDDAIQRRYVKPNDGQRNAGKKSWHDDIKEQLIKYIFSTVDISQFKYEIMNSKSQLNKFISGKYYMAPNYSGKNCFLVFTKLGSKYYSFMVDRKKLSYTFEKVNLDNVYITHCNVDVEMSIYDGTILDGVYVRKNNEHRYIITDIYQFKGSDYTNGNLNHKMIEIQSYLDNIDQQVRVNMAKINNRISLDLFINELNDITTVKGWIDNNVKQTGDNKGTYYYYKDFNIRGLCFYPEITGTKLVFIFDGLNKTNGMNMQNNRIIRNRKSNESKDTESPYDTKNNNRGTMMADKWEKSKGITKKVYVSKTNDPIYAILEMKATKTVDNYKLFAVDVINNNGSKMLRKCQMDIAYVGNIKTSQWCRDIINNSKKGTVFVKCKWRDDKKKWEPLELEEGVRLPSLMEDIRKNLIEMEEPDSDSDIE